MRCERDWTWVVNFIKNVRALTRDAQNSATTSHLEEYENVFVDWTEVSIVNKVNDPKKGIVKRDC